MKIAVLISGDYREFEIAHKSWEFLNNPDVDIYFSTWSRSNQVNEKIGIKKYYKISEDTIKSVIPNCKGVDIGNIILEYSLRSNNRRMINRWKVAVRLMMSSKITYDACIIIRPDLYLIYDSEIFYNWLQNIKEDHIYTLNGDSTKHIFIQDLMMIGTQKSVIKLLELPELRTEEFVDVHLWLAKTLPKLFSNISRIGSIRDTDYTIVRPNSNSGCSDLAQLKKDSRKWYSSLHSQDTVIKEFQGFSGSSVLLIKSLNDFIIRKKENVERNYEKLTLLKQHSFLVPEVIDKQDNVLYMTYIQGMDMKTYLKLEQIDKFVKFVITTVNRFVSINSVIKNYEPIYVEQLSWIPSRTEIPFTTHELIERLPKELPSSLCHGDFTLENIIYKDPDFYMIDPSTGAYDSWVFDIAKLRQDLDGKWFLRYKENKDEFNLELQQIKERLQKEFPIAFDDYLYILMLLRVYKYAREGTIEQQLLLGEIKRLWK